MLLIVEGPDGAGKTYFINEIRSQIAKRLPNDTAVVLHARAPAPGVHALDEYVAPLLSYRPGRGHHIICDRWHLGELVYPKLLGRPTTMDEPVADYIDEFLRSRGAFLTLLTPSEEVIERQITERVAQGGPRGPVPDVRETVKLFADACNRARVDSWRYFGKGSHQLDAREHAENVIMYALEVEREAEWLSDYVTYVGNPSPTNLLIGDVRHGWSPRNDNLWPAFTPRRATSGHYLLSARAQARSAGVKPGRTHVCGIDDAPVQLINVNDVDNVASFIKSAPHRPRVVALGGYAHSALDALGVNHGVVPHPQWWRRFLNSRGVEYGRLISQALLTGDDLRSELSQDSWVND